MASTMDLMERIERLYLTGLRADTSLKIADRLGVDEDQALCALIPLVMSGHLRVIEEGGLLIFLTPAYSRELELAA